MTNGDPPTIGEISRGQAAIAEQIHRLHEESVNQHHRVRNDMAAALGIIHNDLKSIVGDVKAHSERLHAQGREIRALTDDISKLEAAHAKLLWAVIAAFGAVALQAIVFFANAG